MYLSSMAYLRSHIASSRNIEHRLPQIGSKQIMIILSDLQTHFRRICSRTLLKTLWQIGKLLMMSNFPLLPQCFQLYLMIKLSFMEIFHILTYLFSNSSAEDLSYVGRGVIYVVCVFLCNKWIENNEEIDRIVYFLFKPM